MPVFTKLLNTCLLSSKYQIHINRIVTENCNNIVTKNFLYVVCIECVYVSVVDLSRIVNCFFHVAALFYHFQVRIYLLSKDVSQSIILYIFAKLALLIFTDFSVSIQVTNDNIKLRKLIVRPVTSLHYFLLCVSETMFLHQTFILVLLCVCLRVLYVLMFNDL